MSVARLATIEDAAIRGRRCGAVTLAETTVEAEGARHHVEGGHPLGAGVVEIIDGECAGLVPHSQNIHIVSVYSYEDISGLRGVGALEEMLSHQIQSPTRHLRGWGDEA